MYFDGVSKTGGLNDINPQKIEQQKTVQDEKEKQQEISRQGLSAKDSAQISVDASEVSRYQELVKIHREAYGPSNRAEKLNEVKQKINDGFYDDPKVMDRITDQVIEKTAADRIKAKDLVDVKNRKESGFYDRPEVIDRTAENVIRDVLPGSEKKQ